MTKSKLVKTVTDSLVPQLSATMLREYAKKLKLYNQRSDPKYIGPEKRGNRIVFGGMDFGIEEEDKSAWLMENDND